MTLADTGKRAKPLREGIFRMPSGPGEEPALIASRCPQCGAHFIPQRVVCLACAHVGLETAYLAGKGTIYTFTVARQTPPGSILQAPYALAQVLLPERVIVGGPMTDVDVDTVRCGMEVEMVLKKVREDEEGNDLVAFLFRPAGAARSES